MPQCTVFGNVPRTSATTTRVTFLRMLEEMGGVATARSLLAKSTLSSGYTELWLLGRLDITVECVVLGKAFRSLFNEQDLATARRRLIESNFDPSQCEQ